MVFNAYIQQHNQGGVHARRAMLVGMVSDYKMLRRGPR